VAAVAEAPGDVPTTDKRRLEEGIRNDAEITDRRREAEEERLRRIETRLDEVIELLRAAQAQPAERRAS
jgi:hypothetical protein